PGSVWEKSLKTAADCHSPASSLPSITGGFSRRGMRTGLARSAVSGKPGLAAAAFATGTGVELTEALIAVGACVVLVCAHVVGAQSSKRVARRIACFIQLST